MSDQRIQYDEEMVGAGHPTKSDTLNRLALIEADSEGKGKYRYLTKQTSDPSTGSDEGVLYAKEDGGELKLFWRAPEDGEIVEVGPGPEKVLDGEDVLDFSKVGGAWTDPLDTGFGDSYDKDTHVMLPTGFGSTNDSTDTMHNFYAYQLSDSQYRSKAYISGTSQPIPFTFGYQIFNLDGMLSGAIQRGVESMVVSAGVTTPTHDITISALDDYTKARVFAPVVLSFAWYDITVSRLIQSVRLNLTSNTNLQVKGIISSASGSNLTFEIPWVVIPYK